MRLSNLSVRPCVFRASFGILIFLLMLGLFRTVWAADALPGPTFTLIGAGLKIENGASTGQATMVLKADGLDQVAMSDGIAPTIIDQQIPTPPSVTVRFNSKEMLAGTSSRSWLLVASVEGLPPNTSQKRYLQIQFARVERTLEYALTNRFDTAFSWTLKPPPSEVSIRSGEAIEIGITVGQVPASGVRVLQANLIERSRKYAMAPAGLILSRSPNENRESEISLLPNSANRLWLRPKEGSYPVGQFVGSVTIAASQKPEGDTFNLTLFSTGFWSQFFGVMAILAGVGISLLVLTYGRYRLNRNQLLLPAAFIRQKLTSLQSILAQAPDPISPEDTPKTSTRLGQLPEQLSETELENKGYIPPAVLPLSGGTAPKLEEYRQFLKKMDDWAWVLDLIVSHGMATAWSHLKFNSPEPARRAIIQSLRNLDDLVKEGDAPLSDTVSGTIAKELQALKDKLDQAGNPVRDGARSLEKSTVIERTYEQLKLETQYISYTVWIVLGLLTSLVGSYIIVFSNLGFGLGTDYLICLFWGFGIPTGGQQLAQLTSSNLATTLGIPVTK